jgi:hypothetical protein
LQNTKEINLNDPKYAEIEKAAFRKPAILSDEDQKKMEARYFECRDEINKMKKDVSVFKNFLKPDK